MKDLELAKEMLGKHNYALVIVKAGRILHETKASGIRGFLEALDKIGRNIEGSSVADKIVGEAAAQLCAYSHVHEVYAVVLSQCGRDVLEKNNIHYEFGNLVPHILNMKQTDLCPFEKLVAGSKSSEEAYERLRRGTSESSF
jgi:Domain of unknown function (DUF1893)